MHDYNKRHPVNDLAAKKAEAIIEEWKTYRYEGYDASNELESLIATALIDETLRCAAIAKSVDLFPLVEKGVAEKIRIRIMRED